MEKKQKTWQRRGVFALVSHRMEEQPLNAYDALNEEGEEEAAGEKEPDA